MHCLVWKTKKPEEESHFLPLQAEVRTVRGPSQTSQLWTQPVSELWILDTNVCRSDRRANSECCVSLKVLTHSDIGGIGPQWWKRQALPLCLRTLGRGDFNSGHKVEQGTKKNLSVSHLNSKENFYFNQLMAKTSITKSQWDRPFFEHAVVQYPQKKLTAVGHVRLTLMGAWIGEGVGVRHAAFKSWMGSIQCAWGGRQRWAWSVITVGVWIGTCCSNDQLRLDVPRMKCTQTHVLGQLGSRNSLLMRTLKRLGTIAVYRAAPLRSLSAFYS